ncbi:ras association domain-containing protein 5 [Gadus morhua]|uniref:Ras association domain-containing protein 3 n=1 Tax=Gadus morhua TaxID=8049 RepID=A0A8C5ATN1_GADMO|nr:ras association domain-containing protein 5-like [Gadus morhua]
MHQVGKYSPTRFLTLETPITVLGMVHKSSTLRTELDSFSKGYDGVRGTTTSEEMVSPPIAKMRMSKGAKVKRRYPSPQPRSIGSLEAVWNEGGERAKQSPDGRASSAVYSDAHTRSRSDPMYATRYSGELQVNGQAGGQPPRSRKRVLHPDVRTIFSPEKDPRVKEETGEGHCFEAREAATWCDFCCGYILIDCRICSGCKYTCHSQCQHRVVLDCQPGHGSTTETPLNQDQLNNNTQLTNVEKERERRTQLSSEEIRQKVEQYNALTKDHLKMTLIPNGEYTGFIKVQLELKRPVTVRGGTGPEAGEEAFYLPQGSANTLHVSSESTVKQVIVALLRKFTVADNPAKYALYKRYSREEQVYVCKLAEVEKPLYLRLVAGPDADTFGFVLREQQTGEVMWDAFSIPELCNFLRFLEKEEKEQEDAIRRRYDNYRQKLQEALHAPPGAP